eukprot:3540815-Rhodomonas_salina.1
MARSIPSSRVLPSISITPKFCSTLANHAHFGRPSMRRKTAPFATPPPAVLRRYPPRRLRLLCAVLLLALTLFPLLPARPPLPSPPFFARSFPTSPHPSISWCVPGTGLGVGQCHSQLPRARALRPERSNRGGGERIQWRGVECGVCDRAGRVHARALLRGSSAPARERWRRGAGV